MKLILTNIKAIGCYFIAEVESCLANMVQWPSFDSALTKIIQSII